jgi:adenylate cyclase
VTGETRIRVKRPIGAKLLVIITGLLLFSLGIITALVSVMVSSDVRLTAEDNNFTVNRRSAAAALAVLETVRANTLMFLDTLGVTDPPADGKIEAFFFERNRDIAALALAPAEGSARPRLLINERFFLEHELEPSLIGDFLDIHGDSIERPKYGEFLLLNAAPVFARPLLALLCPLGEASPQVAVIFFSAASLAETFGEGANSSYMINGDGDILVHPDSALVQAGANVAGRAFIRSLRESPEQNLQTLYTDENGTRFFGAFQKLKEAGAVVITAIQYDTVFEGVAATTRRNIYLSATVLALSILFIWFFSKTISSPLKSLTQAAGRIKEGKFDISLAPGGRDEIGVLIESFTEMSRGLAERERLKDTFGRFINKEIAERAMRGELSLGGETKLVTVFFSDIRSFTAISEKLEPREVVEFLNDYMSRMVECVNKTGGVVDKFIGDAVMAVWGAPVSSGSPGRDALNCVVSALMMRAALRKFNQNRGGDKKPLIKIGCGINTGDVVAGQIGSTERMEYTVIGDAVNLASRTEALNKPFGTDILITENTWRLAGKFLVTEEMPPVKVKGKEKPVRMFAVVNLRGAPGQSPPQPATLAGVRKLLGIEAPDTGRIDANAEERKYKIGE